MLTYNLSTQKTLGNQFTWNNKQERDARVFSQIDRVLYNQALDAMFPTSEATYHAEGDFDHCPTIVSQYYDAPVRRPFKFYNLCTKDENFMTLVAQKLG